MRSPPIQLCPLERSIDGERSRRIEADALGERQRLGRAGEVDRGEQVVDELGAGAVAGALAEAKHRIGERRQQRGVALEDRRRGRRPSGSSFRRAPVPGRPTSALRSSRCRARRAGPRTPRRSPARSSGRGRRRCPAPPRRRRRRCRTAPPRSAPRRRRRRSRPRSAARERGRRRADAAAPSRSAIASRSARTSRTGTARPRSRRRAAIARPMLPTPTRPRCRCFTRRL